MVEWCEAAMCVPAVWLQSNYDCGSFGLKLKSVCDTWIPDLLTDNTTNSKSNPSEICLKFKLEFLTTKNL